MMKQAADYKDKSGFAVSILLGNLLNAVLNLCKSVQSIAK